MAATAELEAAASETGGALLGMEGLEVDEEEDDEEASGVTAGPAGVGETMVSRTR